MKGLRLRGGCVQVEGTVVDEQVGVVQNASLRVKVECSGAVSVGGVVKLLERRLFRNCGASGPVTRTTCRSERSMSMVG